MKNPYGQGSIFNIKQLSKFKLEQAQLNRLNLSTQSLIKKRESSTPPPGFRKAR